MANLRDLAEQAFALVRAARRGSKDHASEQSITQQRLATLERDLQDERHYAENMAELANERREHMTTLREQLEEAEERLAEANYRLGKAAHFERLVKRRKGLARKLLDALRTKMKAIVALKAGLEGLRTYKAAAEMNQQKLLQRIDALKTELREVEDDAAADLRERDATIARLMVTIREQEANARKLSEASESWRRQYQLLASNSNHDYKTAGEN